MNAVSRDARRAALGRLCEMPKLRPALRALRGERGVTLVELLWVAVLSVMIFSLGLMMLNFAVRTEPQLSERAASIQQARVMMERLTRELRQSASVSVATPTQIVFVTWVKSSTCGGPGSSTAIECQVEYSCSADTCTRTERNADGTGGGAGVETLSGLLSANAFTYLPSSTAPEYVSVRLSFPATDAAGETEDAVTLEDGVNLRNSPL